MIKPRYIKSLTFLLLCNMALWGQQTAFVWPRWLILKSPLVGLFFFGPMQTKEILLRQKTAKPGESVRASRQDYSSSHKLQSI